MKHKRILHLISSSAFLGAERVICELVSAADRDIFQVYVGLMGCSSDIEQQFRQNISDENGLVFNFPCQGKLALQGVHSIRQFLSDHQIDLVHTHGYKSDLYAILAVKWSGSQTRLMATNHTWKLRTLHEQLYKQLDILALRRFQRIVAVSDEVKAEMVCKGVDENRITFVQNGIAVPNLDTGVHPQEIRTALGLGLADVVVGCVASLTEEKAHADLINAFSEAQRHYPRMKLVLVGEGPLKAQLQELVQDRSLMDQVSILGQRSDVALLYRAFDIFALVSHAEGLPMAMLESMAACLPVVVTSVGAIPQVIGTDQNGILVKAGDVAGIADALLTLASQPDLRSFLGNNARATVVDRYSSQRMARDYEKIYMEVLAEL